MPSPESPANRMTTVSSSVTFALGETTEICVLTVACVSSVPACRRRPPRGAPVSTSFRRAEHLVQAGWKVDDLRREMLGDVVHDVTGGDQARPEAALVQERDVAVAVPPHHAGRVTPRVPGGQAGRGRGHGAGHRPGLAPP